MSHTVKFTKMQGAGNDYIYVNTIYGHLDNPEELAVRWSAPHFGIGSDGLVLIGRAVSTEADFSMRIFNADGSEAMMCGNASRCIGKYLYERGFTDKSEIRLETKSGVKVLHLHIYNNKVKTVTVDMLEPCMELPEQYTGERTDGTFVSMGNPHFVKFVDDIDKVDIAAEGKLLEFDKAFPQRCNIEFAQLVDTDKLRTRVWERGSGITMACGTGACATAVAGVLTGRTSRHSSIIMDGGTLEIEWSEADNHVYMTGPAEFVFDGEIEI